MSESPNLQMGTPPGQLKKLASSGVRKWIGFVLVVQVATLGVVIWVALIERDDSAVSPPVESNRELALALEQRSLYKPAAKAWQAVVETDAESRSDPKVWYRIASLWMDGGDFAAAMTPLVQAELLNAGGDPEFDRQIGQKLVECMKKLGMYGEVGRELSRQVRIGGEDAVSSKVLVRMDGGDITEADLDRMIEERAERVFSLQGRTPTPEQLKALVQQFRTQRSQLLTEMLQAELFARRARELKLDEKPAFRQTLELFQQSFLSQELLKQELSAIKPTQVDIESYFRSNPQRYQKPAELDVLVVQMETAKAAQEEAAKISDRASFEKLARENEMLGEDDELLIRKLTDGLADLQLGKTESLFRLEVGEWTKEPIEHAGKAMLVLIDGKRAAVPRPLEDVREQVAADYLRKKQSEVMERLFNELREKYKVKMESP